MKNIILLIFSITISKATAQEYKSLYKPFMLNPNKKNVIFKIGSCFVYEYKIYSKQGDGKVQLSLSDSRNWLISEESKQGYIQINDIRLSSVKKNLFKRVNFSQSQVEYEYSTNPRIPLIEETGIIENKRNLWVHPPRSNFFKVLELAPFPFVSFPIEMGNQWQDQIIIGSHWANEKWAVWTGELKLNITYKVIGKEKIQTKFGDLDVWNLHAISKSDIGTSTLDFSFNEKFGIVRMSYNVLEKFKIEFTLIQVSEKSK